MRVLITGGKGFVATETTKQLEELGHKVISYDLMDGCDIRDREQFENVCIEEGVDRVLHTAAIARFAEADRDPKLAFETNVDGTRNVVEVCKELHIPLVYSSTGSAYMPIKQDPPITEEFPIMGNSVYGCTKVLGDILVREHTPHIVLRYAHIYGAEKRGHGLIGGYWSRIKRGLAPKLYGGGQTNDFAYVKDIARANVLALTASYDKWNQVYNIGSGEELTAKQAGDILCEVVGYKGEIDIDEAREVDAQRFFYNPEKAERMLGYKAEWNFRRGLEDMKKEGGFE